MRASHFIHLNTFSCVTFAQILLAAACHILKPWVIVGEYYKVKGQRCEYWKGQRIGDIEP